jgi:hypothetical protein
MRSYFRASAYILEQESISPTLDLHLIELDPAADATSVLFELVSDGYFKQRFFAVANFDGERIMVRLVMSRMPV